MTVQPNTLSTSHRGYLILIKLKIQFLTLATFQVFNRHITSGYCIGQWRYKTFLPQKVLLDSAGPKFLIFTSFLPDKSQNDKHHSPVSWEFSGAPQYPKEFHTSGNFITVHHRHQHHDPVATIRTADFHWVLNYIPSTLLRALWVLSHLFLTIP